MGKVESRKQKAEMQRLRAEGLPLRLLRFFAAIPAGTGLAGGQIQSGNGGSQGQSRLIKASQAFKK
jgi:hypothetical protein